MQIGAETKKLWAIGRQSQKLSENFATAKWVAKISQLRNPLAKISQGVSQLRNHLQAHVCHFASWNSIFAAVKPCCKIISKLRTKVQNHLQVANQGAKSSLSCEPSYKIIFKLWMKFPNHLQVAKSTFSCEMDNSTCKIHLCNLRYLQPT